MKRDWAEQRCHAIALSPTSLAEADHYPHIVQYGQYELMNVGTWW